MNNWVKPNIIISKCLNNHPCRYNGESSNSKLVSKLNPFINIIEVCPEEGIGLNTPRNPIRLVQKNKKILLIEPKTLKNYTSLMTEFANESCINLESKHPHGFIFKTKSPSCALHDANIYSDETKGACAIRKSSGLYSSAIKTYFPTLPIEDEGRLSNFSIRNQFLIKIFTLANFYSLKDTNKIYSIIQFHTKNKFLFMSYNQTLSKEMGQILARYGSIDFNTTFSLYESKLLDLLRKTPSYTSIINVFTHIYSHFSNMLRSNEKDFFFELLDKYKHGNCPYSILINTLKGYAIRFNDTYILNQSLLSPYPEQLIDFSDSGKGIIRK
ncbi:MAG: YbgA family protein [Clostridium sp.]|uniref:YbgA family protein n=1 Tax=Clostridium sp. TaxID=1506 RepID=UPI003F2E592D